MASPVLSRASSTSAFAPGPHRRSHPNLQNLTTLSLAPLTPKYPIDPADYDAYFDPSTSELHTSASLSRIATLPSPSGILTTSPVRSRDPSQTRRRRHRKVKSHVQIHEPDHNHDHDREHDSSFDNNRLHKSTTEKGEAIITDRIGASTNKLASFTSNTNLATSRSKSSLRLTRLRTAVDNNTADPTWLVQTGLSLTESSRETKGQSWLSKRDSSTSLNLTNTPLDYFSAIDKSRSEGRTPRSGRATPARSRVGSRNASRNRASNGLRMTMGGSGATSPTLERGLRSAGASFVTAAELEIEDQIREEDEEDNDTSNTASRNPSYVQPNWTDAKTQAEFAAQLQEELEDDEDFDIYGGGTDGDPYGLLDFENTYESDGENEYDELDEEEVKRAMSRYRLGFGLGGWMGLDGAIDALLRVEEVNTEGDDLGRSQGRGSRNTGMDVDVEKGDEFRSGRGSIVGVEGEGADDGNIEAPGKTDLDANATSSSDPSSGVWVDVNWLGRLLRRSAGI